MVRCLCTTKGIPAKPEKEAYCRVPRRVVHFTKTSDALHTVLVTTYGLTHNLHSGSIYSTVTMQELFKE